MRSFLLILMFLISVPVLSQQNVLAQEVVQDKGVLIKAIVMEGFVLQDKAQFVKIFKTYRNKYLTTVDMEAILAKIRVLYEREGYQQLVSISYKVTKHRLVYTASMIS